MEHNKFLHNVLLDLLSFNFRGEKVNKQKYTALLADLIFLRVDS